MMDTTTDHDGCDELGYVRYHGKDLGAIPFLAQPLRMCLAPSVFIKSSKKWPSEAVF